MTPPALEFPVDDRGDCARSLASDHRLAIVASLVRGQHMAVNPGGRTYQELRGIHRYQRWLTESGRVADRGGSDWWREVNGRMVLDMAEAANPGPEGAAAPSEPVQAWTTYWTNRTRGARSRLCWDAHQCSLSEAARLADGLLGREPPAERDFIAMALSSVEIASLANLPTGRAGSRVVGGFCRVFYPDRYPADDGAGAEGRALLTRATSGRFPGMRIVAEVVRGRANR